MDYDETLNFLHTILHRDEKAMILSEADQVWLQAEDFSYHFSPSLLLPPPETGLLSTYLSTLPEEPPPYLMLLIEAGSAAIGYFEHGEPVLHKALSTYMVRQKQGKSQLKHLNQKGKSRLGSRIRLRNTITFFEQINNKLQEWGETDYVQYIFYHSSIPHWNLLHESKVACPFGKHDQRLQTLPFAIYTPNFEELNRVNTQLLSSSYRSLSLTERTRHTS